MRPSTDYCSADDFNHSNYAKLGAELIHVYENCAVFAIDYLNFILYIIVY
jgi:hypothetical protein